MTSSVVPAPPGESDETPSPVNGSRPKPRPPAGPSQPPPPPPTVRGGDERFRRIQLGMFVAGAVLMPLGILAICIGWYGSAHAHYEYDQNTYLISGGILGLGLTFFGGFLYFGAWLARVAVDQRDSARQLTDAVLALAERLAPEDSAAPSVLPSGMPTAVLSSELGERLRAASLVVTATGSTVHRRDCPLVETREDLRPYEPDGTTPNTCRVCRPEL